MLEIMDVLARSDKKIFIVKLNEYKEENKRKEKTKKSGK